MTRHLSILLSACLLVSTVSAQEIGGSVSAPAVPAGPVWAAARVVSDGGAVLRDVTLQWRSDGARLRLTRRDGSWRDLAPDDLWRAEDGAGRDLRREIMAARPTGGGAARAPTRRTYGEVGVVPDEGRSLGGDRSAVPPFRRALSASAGWGAFGGQWLARYHPGLSLQGALRFGTGRRTWVTVLYRNQAAGSDEGAYFDWNLNRDVWVEESARVQEYCLMMGWRLNPGAAGRTVVTGECGLSAVRRSSRVAVSETGADLRSGEDSSGALAVVVQFGVLLPVGDHWLVDLQARAGLKLSFFDDDDLAGAVFAVHAGFGWVRW